MRLPLAMLVTVALATGAGAADVIDIGEGHSALNAVLYRPSGTGPFPAVVALHGCSGLLNASGQIVGRFADWGTRLSAAGVAVVFPDSFTPRGRLPTGTRAATSPRSASTTMISPLSSALTYSSVPAATRRDAASVATQATAPTRKRVVIDLMADAIARLTRDGPKAK